MKNHPIPYLAVLFYLTAHYLDTCIGQTTTYFMDSFPINERKSIKLLYNSFDSSIVLKASEKRYPSDGQYSFTVNIPIAFSEMYRIYGTVQSFRIRDTDQFRIISTSGVINDTIYDSKFFVSIPKSFYSESEYNKALIFELKLAGSKRFEGFEITLTTAKYCYATSDRQSDDFYCSNDYCIKDVWTCNERNNCGNNNDEDTFLCSKAIIIGFSVGGISLLIGFIVVFVVICRRRRRRPTTPGSTNALIVQPLGNVYPGYEVHGSNALPPTTRPYNTNQTNWQQFPDHTTAAPPPYQSVTNQTFNSTYPQNPTSSHNQQPYEAAIPRKQNE